MTELSHFDEHGASRMVDTSDKPETWAFALGKFLTDPIWWFYLFWFPKYLVQGRGLTQSEMAICVALSDAGWMSEKPVLPRLASAAR